MTRPKVFVYTPLDESGESHEEIAAAGCEVTLGEDSWRVKLGATADDVLALAAGADAMIGAIIRGLRFDASFMDRLPNLRIIAKYSIGYDDVDIEAAAERGILVTHAPTEANWGGVAEGTMAMMLGLLKQLRQRDRHVKEGGWRVPALDATYLGRRQDGYGGITVGIIGLGRIGGRVADLLAPWRVRLIGCDPYVDESKFAHHNVAAVDLETLLTESDVVSIHCDLTAETRHLIAAAQFSCMKPTAILLNAARGPIVDGDALFDALDGDVIAGAALDVFEIEPVPAQSPLLGLGDKILVSPHNISATKGGSLGPAIPWATGAALTALRGDVPRHVVNGDAVAKWRERFGGISLISGS